MNLTVKANTTLVLDIEHPPRDMAAAVFKDSITDLTDLVRLNLVDEPQLTQMFTAAQASTQEALARPSSRPTMIPGTTRADLGRYSGYINRLPAAQASEAQLVWNMLRSVSPTTLGSTTLAKLRLDQKVHFWQFLFDDVTVKNGAVLKIAGTTQLFKARKIVIEANAQIVVQGSSLIIQADSIQGF